MVACESISELYDDDDVVGWHMDACECVAGLDDDDVNDDDEDDYNVGWRGRLRECCWTIWRFFSSIFHSHQKPEGMYNYSLLFIQGISHKKNAFLL